MSSLNIGKGMHGGEEMATKITDHWCVLFPGGEMSLSNSKAGPVSCEDES